MTLPSFPQLCRQHNATVQPPVNLGFSTIETNQISSPPKSIKNPYNQIHKISHPQPASPPNQLQIPHVQTLKKKKEIKRRTTRIRSSRQYLSRRWIGVSPIRAVLIGKLVVGAENIISREIEPFRTGPGSTR